MDGDLFASWKNVGADKFTASLGPNRLDIPELRVVEANAKLIIEDDRSFNAARLLVQPPAPPPKPPQRRRTAARAADDPFPVRIRRVRFQNAKLDFTDLSLRPQFAAKIYELNGVVNGLSSSRAVAQPDRAGRPRRRVRPGAHPRRAQPVRAAQQHRRQRRVQERRHGADLAVHA